MNKAFLPFFRGRIYANQFVYFVFRAKISYEHEDYIWLPLHEALKKVTFDNAKKLLQKADKFRKKN